VSGTAGPPGTLVETRVHEDVLVFTLGGEEIATSYGANCTAVLGRNAVLLVDPFIAPAHARLVEEKIREKTPAPIRHVVLTHHHTDHALGASWFAARGAVVHAHRAAARPWRPSIPVSSSRGGVNPSSPSSSATPKPTFPRASSKRA
jgi:glyoxylase-like metal-dependent hydrolase (beta-lactamase superfamily II)